MYITGNIFAVGIHDVMWSTTMLCAVLPMYSYIHMTIEKMVIFQNIYYSINHLVFELVLVQVHKDTTVNATVVGLIPTK